MDMIVKPLLYRDDELVALLGFYEERWSHLHRTETDRTVLHINYRYHALAREARRRGLDVPHDVRKEASTR